jgi:DNA helicase-2/ATP-dependent DNA helicase PcrA
MTQVTELESTPAFEDEGFSPEDLFAPITDGLNPPQKEAVLTTEGPLLILAGAGSGKTRVLTRRIAYLLATKKARRNEIMAVTFTNKAAKEMSERVSQLCGPGRFPDLGTFHAVCARWLRRDGASVGLNPRFAIFATAEQLVVMKESVRELGLDEKMFTPRGMLSLISGWKNKMISLQQARAAARCLEDRYRVDVCELYQKKLGQNQAVDFDDILWKTVEMLQTNQEIREAYQQRIKYVLIDEYQDVNPVQYELLRILAEPQRNLCTVGDDDQSIYAFRGADVSILHRFEQDFPEAKVIKLEQNYRSTSSILEASNAVVANNKGRKAKTLWTDKEGGAKLTYYLAGDGRDEGRYIANQIKMLAKTMGNYAILYRTNAQSRLLEEAMMISALPYKVVGGLRFYERREIKDLLGYLNVLINPSDSFPRGAWAPPASRSCCRRAPTRISRCCRC